MLFDLTRPFTNQFILFNLFRYITFRSGAACLTALVVSFIRLPRLPLTSTASPGASALATIGASAAESWA